MAKLKRPACPYCHKRISYIGSMFLKTKGEYTCPQCKCISNVVIGRSAYAIASMVCIVALLIVVFYSIAGNHASFLGIVCVLAPFVIFYLVVPLFVRLVPCKDRSAVKKILDRTAAPIPSEAAYQTTASPTDTRPVMLDVEEDFSARFMRVKKHTVHQTETDEEEPAEMPLTSEPEEIHNTRIAFEINHETQMMAEDRTLFSESEETPKPDETVPEEPYSVAAPTDDNDLL